ncbi:MAG: bifunctional adenosylcobinamide kinase/adenosylcobinamide-phosphate guanylyltransferase [Eubacteriales bacterium]|nr:bifunctional adenosylcobinamide kinase/adenosylcobinamide-phosphate guanylyltransferase [Eubacteriales bacterium]
MKMVIGGVYQGKDTYAEETFGIQPVDWIDGDICTRRDLYNCKAVMHFQSYIRRAVENGEDLSGFAEDLIRYNPNMVIVTDELGCGIVPMDPIERKYRETDGRICTKLASYSDEVHRVVCGIGVVIKNTEE